MYPASGLYEYSLAAADEGVVAYQLVGVNLPPEAEIDGNGNFSCYFDTNAEYPYSVYDFNVIATDAGGQKDRLHVVITTSELAQGLPAFTAYAPSMCVEYNASDESQGHKEIQLWDWQRFGPSWIDKELTVVAEPSHGVLLPSANGYGVLYAPDPGYRGLDAFSYYWTYTAYDYYEPHEVILTGIKTNIGQVQVQVGSWVNLTAQETYAPDKTIMAVGDTTTVTLTLQNPRSDGLPTAGYWTLEYLAPSIRVYDDHGKEILPYSQNLAIVEGVGKQIVLTVKGFAGGDTNIIAHWDLWDCVTMSTESSDYLAPNWPYFFHDSNAISVTVVGVDIYRDTKITNLTSTVIVGQHIVLKGVVTPGNLEITSKQWTVPGNDDIRIKNYTSGTVTTLMPVDFQTENMKFYWIAGGQNLVVTYAVTIGGKVYSGHTTFNVDRPQATMKGTKTSNDPSVDIVDPGLPGRAFGMYFGTGASPGITWDASVTTSGGEAGDFRLTQTTIQSGFALGNDADSTPFIWTSASVNYKDGDTVLDNMEAYAGVVVPIGNNKTKKLLINQADPNSYLNDTPGVDLDNTAKYVSMSDRYSSYLMYKPAGNDSIWVSLRILGWYWYGTAEYDFSSGKWNENGIGNGVVGGSFDTTSLPVWNVDVSSFEWKEKK